MRRSRLRPERATRADLNPDAQTIAPIVGFVAGGLAMVVGIYLANRRLARSQAQAEDIVAEARSDAEAQAREMLVKAQEQSLAMQEEGEQRDRDLDEREAAIEERLREQEKQRHDLDRQRRDVERGRKDLDKRKQNVQETEQRVVAARDKAEAGAPEAEVVLAADTSVVLDGEIFGKPRDGEDAVAMLGRLSGREHEVLTGVAVAWSGRIETALSRTRVRFRDIGRDEALQYWQSGEPADKAGAYGIQGLGGVFVSNIEGSYSGVVGLPVFETARLLSRAGIPVTGLSGASDR